MSSVSEFRDFLEDSFIQKMSQAFPLKLPREILLLIWEMTQTGENPFDVGRIGNGEVGQKEELVVRRKLLLVTKGISIQLCRLSIKQRLKQDDLSVEVAIKFFNRESENIRKLVGQEHLH